MNARQRRELVDKLLTCPCMDNHNVRNSVVADLPTHIQTNIERSQTDRDDVANILKTCLNYSNGLEELIAIVHGYERDSIPMQEVNRLLLALFDFSVDQEEQHLKLLAIASKIDIPVTQLKEFYRALLPDGIEEREEPLGLFSMLSHLWNLSRQPETQTRNRTYPILDFLEQLARATRNRRVVTELREWSTQVISILYQSGKRETDVAVLSEDATQVHDSRRLTILASVLAYLYPTIEESGEIIANARLNPVSISFREMPLANWQNILSEAKKREKVQAIIKAALSEHPENEWLLLAQREEKPVAKSRAATTKFASAVSAEEILPPAPSISSQSWLQRWPQPISFLEQGMLKARSVARVVILSDGNETGSCTGFLTDSNLLIVPNYLFETPEQAQEAIVQFNFQRTLGELYAPTEEFQLAPAEGFATSKEDLWIAVRVRGDANQNWGALHLTYADPKVGDPLSIVHHGYGGPKQIELLNHLVAYVGNNRVQYLAHLMVKNPGSGGAPVFDGIWEVVAVHHKMGWMRKPGSKQAVYRREGTHVNAIIDGLKSAGLYTEP